MNYTPEDKANWDQLIHMMEETLVNSGQRAFFNTFIKQLKLYAVTSDTLYISGDNAFNLNYMKNRYGTVIYSTVPLVFGVTPLILKENEVTSSPEGIVTLAT